MTNEEIEKPFRDLMTLDVECWNPEAAAAPFVEIARALVTQAYEECIAVADSKHAEHLPAAIGGDSYSQGACDVIEAVAAQIRRLKDSLT